MANTTHYMIQDREGRDLWGAFRSLKAALAHLDAMLDADPETPQGALTTDKYVIVELLRA